MTSAEPTDLDLLRAHLRGDSGAFEALARRHADRLWAVALRTLGDREEAADAVQDALISAFRSAATFRGDAAVTTWLHRIVVNACLDRVRRRNARPTTELGDTDATAPTPDTDLALDVHTALARLHPDQRAAVVLVDMEGYAVAEAARLLGVPVGTVKSRCARGRARLAVLLGYLRDPDDLRNLNRSGNPGGAGDVPSESGPAPGHARPSGAEAPA